MKISEMNVLVTGASRGIGKRIAEAFALSGANVVLNASRESDYFSETMKEFEERGFSVMACACDVSDQEAVMNMQKDIKEKFGSIHVLVNNAGITRDMLLMRMSEEQWDSVIDINLKGAFNCTKAFIRPMMKQGFGRIINISSVVGLTGNPGQVNYAASKAGMIGMTKAVAKETGKKGVTCNAVAPGFIESDMTDVLPEEIKAEYLKNIAVGRFGIAEDVAHAVLFLADEKSSFITGQVITVDGGMVM